MRGRGASGRRTRGCRPSGADRRAGGASGAGGAAGNRPEPRPAPGPAAGVVAVRRRPGEAAANPGRNPRRPGERRRIPPGERIRLGAAAGAPVDPGVLVRGDGLAASAAEHRVARIGMADVLRGRPVAGIARVRACVGRRVDRRPGAVPVLVGRRNPQGGDAEVGRGIDPVDRARRAPRRDILPRDGIRRKRRASAIRSGSGRPVHPGSFSVRRAGLFRRGGSC